MVLPNEFAAQSFSLDIDYMSDKRISPDQKISDQDVICIVDRSSVSVLFLPLGREVGFIIHTRE